jgi:hypothetical protein
MTWLWGTLAAAALLWPDRISGAFDGVPLDRIPEALVVGAAFPLLLALAPNFLRTRTARALVVLLLAWRAAASMLLVQDGWCVRFQPERPYVKDATGAPHAWDLRADWRSPDPTCSAVVTRPYSDLRDFPAWFFNLPPANESWPVAADLPPEATVVMTVHGFLDAPRAGRLQIEQRPDAPTQVIVDGRRASDVEALPSGVHAVEVRTTLMGGWWRFVPRWNDHDLWSSRIATVTRPSRLDVFVRRWLAWIPAALVILLIGAWTAVTLVDIADGPVIAWTVAASAAMAVLVAGFDRADLARDAVAALAAAAFVPTSRRWQSTRGALLLIGVPWMTLIVVSAASAIGRFVIYEAGNDFWMFQRFAYRIVMQGYWLEGGSPTFWFQPLYRWIVGLLHLIFGDSSAGEWYWDGACLLAGSLFAFRIVRPFAGFRWALVAAVLPLTTFLWGTAQYLIGRGLSEISSAGLMYAAALCAIRARNGYWPAAALAGALATLAFYTRLNNLPMACGVALFALQVPPRRGWWREPAIIVGALALSVVGFAWRTWHYTGHFSVFYGTQRGQRAVWQAGMSIGTVAQRALGSVMMVLTVNDPARFDPYALPVLTGAVVALLAAVRVPRLREVPAAAVLFFFSTIAGSLVALGGAYAGRFSVHVIPITCALTVCGAAAITRRSSTSAADVPTTGPRAHSNVLLP